MKKVEYSVENVSKCWCGQCPVQKDSSCAKQAYEESSGQIDQGTMPPPERLPGLYCATGTATCEDLKPTERCLCPQCLVWGENDLRANHYCVLSEADSVGSSGQ